MQFNKTGLSNCQTIHINIIETHHYQQWPCVEGYQDNDTIINNCNAIKCSEIYLGFLCLLQM